MTDAETGCQLYAVIEAGDAAPERLAAALEAAEIASVLVAPAAGGALDAAAARPLVQLAQANGSAALIAGDARLARTLRADGVHLARVPDLVEAYAQAREILGAGAIIGVDPGLSRHDAMTLAEAGADYVGFGAPAHVKDRERARTRRDELAGWWAEIFQVPCVAFDVEDADEARELAREAHVDFVAVTLAAEQPPAEARELVAEVAAAIATRATAD